MASFEEGDKYFPLPSEEMLEADNELLDGIIEAMDSGEIVKWRESPDGQQWYRRVIHGEEPREGLITGAGIDPNEPEEEEEGLIRGYDAKSTVEIKGVDRE